MYVYKPAVQDRNTGEKMVITSLKQDTFKTKWEKNASYELSFEAYDNGQLDFKLLRSENIIYYAEQQYVIKHISEKYDGTADGVSVTAIHIFYDLASRRKNDVKPGWVSYTINEALNYLFSSVGSGFTYQVHGYFPSKAIENFGNVTITDGVSQIIQTFGAEAVYPDNKVCHIYSKDEWVKRGGEPIRYRYNAKEMTLDWDSLGLVNHVQVVSTATPPLFSPFYVDNQQSIEKWGIREGSERFETDKLNRDQAAAQAKQKFVLEPSISLSVEIAGGTDIKPGDERVIQNLPGEIQTTAQVVGIETAPYVANSAKITLNSNRKNYLDIDSQRQREILAIKAEMKQNKSTAVKTWVVGSVEDII